VAHHGNRKANIPKVSHPVPKPADEIAVLKPVINEKKQLKIRLQATDHQFKRRVQESIPQLRELAEEIPHLSEPPTVEKVPEPPKLKTAVAISKRRFRVIHENELRAEEETRPKIYHTENFVRLGTGRSEEPVREERRPALTLPLPHKSNQ
jgi:hypothetical protein